MIYLVLLLIALPIAEIYVLLQAGGYFGAWPVIAAVVGTALLGGVIIRWQGLQALYQLRKHSTQGEVPVEPVIDGFFLLIAAPFLMTPGFITDAFGFLLLVPPLRHAVARAVLERIRKSIADGKTSFTFRQF